MRAQQTLQVSAASNRVLGSAPVPPRPAPSNQTHHWSSSAFPSHRWGRRCWLEIQGSHLDLQNSGALGSQDLHGMELLPGAATLPPDTHTPAPPQCGAETDASS